MYLEQPATVKSQNVKRQSQEYKQVQLSQTDRTSTFVVDRVKILPCIKFDHKQNLFAVFLTMCTHVGGPNASDLVKKTCLHNSAPSGLGVADARNTHSPTCVIVPNLVILGQTVLEICRKIWTPHAPPFKVTGTDTD